MAGTALSGVVASTRCPIIRTRTICYIISADTVDVSVGKMAAGLKEIADIAVVYIPKMAV